MEPFIGQICLFGFNYAPQGWAKCEGQLLSISGNESLYSLLSTTYGGNGTTTFALPDLRGRVPIGEGQGSGLYLYQHAQKGGVDKAKLTIQQMPAHEHAVQTSSKATITNTVGCKDGAGDTGTPIGNYAAKIEKKKGVYFDAYSTDANATMHSSVSTVDVPINCTTGSNGGNEYHSNMQPFLAIGYCICVKGLYPSRD